MALTDTDTSEQPAVAAAAKAAARAAEAEAGGIEPFARSVIRHNQAEFLKAARGQRFAFATMKWMFLVVFLIALGAMIAAIRIATDVPEEGYDWSHAGVVGGVAAMAIVLFALLLYMRPLAALERNSVVQSFLTVVVNSYWTRLLYVKEAADVDVKYEVFGHLRTHVQLLHVQLHLRSPTPHTS